MSKYKKGSEEYARLKEIAVIIAKIVIKMSKAESIMKAGNLTAVSSASQLKN